MSIAPTRSYRTSAGMDLYSCEPFIIKPLTQGVINTGVCCKMPHGYYGRIADRSSIAIQHQVFIMGGVIDEGYTGSIHVIMYNLSKTKKYYVYANSKIAQLIIEKICYPELQCVRELPQSDRGDKGFGSSD